MPWNAWHAWPHYAVQGQPLWRVAGDGVRIGYGAARPVKLGQYPGEEDLVNAEEWL
jgi:hypothetical protein